MKKYIYWIVLLFTAGTLFAGFHNKLSLTEYKISNIRIPDGFDGYRIAVVSDLHAKSFGQEQTELIRMLRDSKCDLICFSGDLVSNDTEDFSPVWDLIDGVNDIPMVYVDGNNELSMKDHDLFLGELKKRGVIVLDGISDTTLTLERGNDRILIHGYHFMDMRRLDDRLPVAEKGVFNVLIYHDPYCFEEAALKTYDLMISGHIHGGVVRLPLIGSPLERLKIEPYTKGLYEMKASCLVLSGGLGGQDAFPRFFNDPEMVLITLESKEK